MLKKILTVICFIILIGILIFSYSFYQTNNLNGFVKAEKQLGLSEFKRDYENKYLDKSSYNIVSETYNDAMFLKTIDVKKNTPYKITCMVKTENVESELLSSGVGAQIAIEGTTERSTAISGTQDWVEIELIVNSKDRDKINIGFRLGGYLGDAKGTVWFSDFKIEEGIPETDNIWNFGCFIFNTTDVNINGNKVDIAMSENEMANILETIERFDKSTEKLSENKMEVEYDINMVDTPLQSLSYDSTFGYYVAPEDIESQIKDKVNEQNYDHIFIIIKLRK